MEIEQAIDTVTMAAEDWAETITPEYANELFGLDEHQDGRELLEEALHTMRKSISAIKWTYQIYEGSK